MPCYACWRCVYIYIYLYKYIFIYIYIYLYLYIYNWICSPWLVKQTSGALSWATARWGWWSAGGRKTLPLAAQMGGWGRANGGLTSKLVALWISIRRVSLHLQDYKSKSFHLTPPLGSSCCHTGSFEFVEDLHQLSACMHLSWTVSSFQSLPSAMSSCNTTAGNRKRFRGYQTGTNQKNPCEHGTCQPCLLVLQIETAYLQFQCWQQPLSRCASSFCL